MASSKAKTANLMAPRRLFGPDVPGVVERLKRENARDILLFGITGLVATLFGKG
jgi:hypothetical protein